MANLTVFSTTIIAPSVERFGMLGIFFPLVWAVGLVSSGALQTLRGMQHHYRSKPFFVRLELCAEMALVVAARRTVTSGSRLCVPCRLCRCTASITTPRVAALTCLMCLEAPTASRRTRHGVVAVRRHGLATTP